MKIRLETTKLSALIARIKSNEGQRQTGILQALWDGGHLIQQRAQTKYLVSGPLHRRSGRLLNSITVVPPRRTGKSYQCIVGTKVFYGKIHEYGLRKPIRPVKAQCLAFRVGPPYGPYGKSLGKWVRTKKVVLRPKPWLGPATKDSEPTIIRLLGKAGAKII